MRGLRRRTGAVVAFAVVVGVAGCSGEMAARPTAAATGQATASERPSSSPSRFGSPAARPTQSLPPQRAQLRWVDLHGAAVPSSRKAGPHRRRDGAMRAWRHSRLGAALASSYYAAVVDPRMPARLWRTALRSAAPARAAKAAVRRFERAGPSGTRPRPPQSADAGPPVQVWRPPVSIIATSNPQLHPGRASFRVWSRSDSGRVWRSRRVSVTWKGGDWRLRLPITQWRRSGPPDDLRPLASGVRGGAR